MNFKGLAGKYSGTRILLFLLYSYIPTIYVTRPAPKPSQNIKHGGRNQATKKNEGTPKTRSLNTDLSEGRLVGGIRAADQQLDPLITPIAHLSKEALVPSMLRSKSLGHWTVSL